MIDVEIIHILIISQEIKILKKYLMLLIVEKLEMLLNMLVIVDFNVENLHHSYKNSKQKYNQELLYLELKLKEIDKIYLNYKKIVKNQILKYKIIEEDQ